MLYELVLLSVAIMASSWGVMLLRRRAAPTFAWALLATAAAGWIAYAGRLTGGPRALGVLGAIAVGAGAVLLVVGPTVRQAARWAVATDRLRLAAVLVEIARVLQPGTGDGDQATLAALREVRSGEIDGAVDALRRARGQAPTELHRAFDERITLLYVVAMRWEDAVAHAESTLFDLPAPAPAPAPAAVAADDSAADGQPPAPDVPARGAGDVARELGMSPPVWVELCAAYGRLGQIDRAAEMAVRFERAAADIPGMAWLVHRAHLVFLAAAGRVEAVGRLLERGASAYVRPASRLYWSGLAAERAGDREAARDAYRAALGHARRVPRVKAEIQRSLDGLDDTRPAELSPETARIADDLAAEDVVLPAPPRRQAAHLTTGLIAVNTAIAIVCALLFGPTSDLGVVVRAGGNLRAAVDHGEWWRVPASTFVHVGWLHLLVNMLGLWAIGRLAEGFYGPVRTFAIYVGAGVAGAVASHIGGSAGVSAGASGAIFGVLGALLVELVIAGKRYSRPGRRALLGSLAFVAAVQVVIGFMYTAIDQWAHVAGLAGGIVLGLALTPHGPAARLRLMIARSIAVAGAGILVAAAVLVATTDFSDTLARYGRTARVLGQVQVVAPSTWAPEDGELIDPDLYVALSAVRKSVGPQAGRFDAWRAGERVRAKQRGFTDAIAAPDKVVPAPPGWKTAELIATADNDLGAQHYRVIVFARPSGAETLLGALYVPDVLAREASGDLAAVIASIRPVP
jgi:membrane associated rhomboid family serine protease